MPAPIQTILIFLLGLLIVVALSGEPKTAAHQPQWGVVR